MSKTPAAAAAGHLKAPWTFVVVSWQAPTPRGCCASSPVSQDNAHMVAVTHSLSASAAAVLDSPARGLGPDDAARVEAGPDWTRGLYGVSVLAPASRPGATPPGFRPRDVSCALDADTRLAALCLRGGDARPAGQITRPLSVPMRPRLVRGLQPAQRPARRHPHDDRHHQRPEIRARARCCKMLLAMVEDIRWCSAVASAHPDAALFHRPSGRPSATHRPRAASIHAPLGQPAGVWQLRNGSWRISPSASSSPTDRIAQNMLDERRVERKAVHRRRGARLKAGGGGFGIKGRCMAAPSTSTASTTRCAPRGASTHPDL